MPLPDPHETEAKFAILNQKTVDRFAVSATLAPRLSTPLSPHTAETVDVYFDTPSFDLIRRGLALRTRRSGERLLVTAKSLEARRNTSLYDRIEREESVDAATRRPIRRTAPPIWAGLVAAHNPDSREAARSSPCAKRTQRAVQQAAGNAKPPSKTRPWPN